MHRNLLLAALAMLLLGSCRGAHFFDSSQVPQISVGRGLHPDISWTPSPAYQLTVYEGPEDGDGLGAIWSLRGGSNYANELASPVTDGKPPAGSEFRPAPPLEAGKTYTVTVFRKDPKGSGDGFTNTRHRYVGKKTFTAQAE